VTLRFPGRVPPPPALRGLVHLDPARCVGCATCAYVCASGAIHLTEEQAHYVWAYDPGRCTFCGRCVDVCPGGALAMESERPPIYTQAGALRQVHRQAYPRCPECGQPARPVNDIVLARAFDEITDEVRGWSRLCQRCRQRRYQPALIETGYAARSRSNGR
jgi:formate hydrogenlyase subunit 6/NADH:ubiquinone oxidoreductase subunit I